MSARNGRTVRGFLSDSETGAITDSFAEQEHSDRHEVLGQVKGTVPEGATVRAVLTRLHERVLDEQVVGEAVVDEGGWYQVQYQRPAPQSESDSSLTVRLYAPNGELLGESVPVLSPPRRAQIHLRPTRIPAVPSEYALLEREISDGLESGMAGIEGADESVLEEVSAWLDVDSERLMLFQNARALESDTGLPAPMFYAMGRNGLGPSPDDLVDVPIHELRTTIEEAIADGIVDADQFTNLDSLVDQLAQQIIEYATRTDRQSVEPGLAEILSAADIPAETITRVLR